jgi:S-adenosylmethionine synthetase
VSSADYVFDGTAPPYTPTAVTNPLQVYGKMKRDGEVEVLKAGIDGASVVVLRVPVLRVSFFQLLFTVDDLEL